MFNPIASVWFWLMVIGVLGLIATIITFEFLGETSNNSTSTPWWIWILFTASGVFFLISFVLYCMWIGEQNRFVKLCECKEKAEAGEECAECDKMVEQIEKTCKRVSLKRKCKL